ncbi:MAG: FtsX-like permease family protein [Chitinivibrionales bacterium]|nr:FtsX-like permease family protein [Chitinivibrionales bacterium]
MEFFVALRYLRGKRKIGFISLIAYFSAFGVFLGTTVLVIALSIANGFEKEVRDRIISIFAHARVYQYYREPFSDYDSLRNEIMQHPQVIGAAPYLSGKGALEYSSGTDQGNTEGVLINGIDDSLEATVTDLGNCIIMGELELESAESTKGRSFPGIILGVSMADKLGIRPGAEVVLGFLGNAGEAMDPMSAVRMNRFTVTGIFETGMYEYDYNLAYISIESAQNLFDTRGVEGIQLKTTDLFKADRILQEVKAHLGGYPFTGIDWKRQNKSLFKWMKLERLVIFIVISLIIIIAAFNIISSLIMMILEKRREIGILISMGATTGSIMKIFMLNGVVIGFLGSTLGALAGVLLCYLQYHFKLISLPGDIYFINKLPVLIRALDVIAIYLAANLICFVATLYPALQASRILPAESLRYE